MTTISQEKARQVAIKLTEKYDKQVKVAKTNLDNVFTAHVESKIPKDIMALYLKQGKTHFSCCQSVWINEEPVNDILKLNKLLPCGDMKVRLTKEVKEAYSKLKLVKKERDELKDSIYNALLTLKTIKKITTEFPEAAKLLITTTMDLTDIKSKLK